MHPFLHEEGTRFSGFGRGDLEKLKTRNINGVELKGAGEARS